MKLVSLGVDTLRPKFVASEPLPVNDEGFRDEMIDRGWLPRVSSHVLKDVEDTDERFRQSTTYSHQLEGDTLRYFIINAGRDLVAEYSVPRLVNESIFNFDLASPNEAWQSVGRVKERLISLLPPLPYPTDFELDRFQRIDIAADVYSEEYRTGLISAAARFKIPGARRQEVVIYPNETAIIKSPSATFRVYNKGIETAKKTADLLVTLDEEDSVREALDNCRMRLEYVFKEKRGYGASEDVLKKSILDFVDALERGFGAKALRIGGLSQIRKQIDDLDIHEMTRASLYMFVVRYLALGSQGLKDFMSKTAYYSVINKIREYGLHIDEMSAFEGTVDLNPFFDQLHEHKIYNNIFRELHQNRKVPLELV